MNEIPKPPMVIGSAIPITHHTMFAVSPDSELLTQIKLLSAKVERLEATIEGLKELAGMHGAILEEIGRLMEQANGRTN